MRHLPDNPDLPVLVPPAYVGLGKSVRRSDDERKEAEENLRTETLHRNAPFHF